MTAFKTHKPLNTSKNQGAAAEALARNYLLEQGWEVVAHNFRCSYGEIDLIIQQGQWLAFVEVKQRKTDRFGSAAAMVTPQKQHKIMLTSQYFLQVHRQYQKFHLRYDVLAIDTASGSPQITWLTNAFYAQ